MRAFLVSCILLAPFWLAHGGEFEDKQLKAANIEPTADGLQAWLVKQFPADTRELPQLIKQLGAEKYPERKAASDAILDLGAAALPGLKAAQSDSEPEVRLQSLALTKQIQEVLAADPFYTVLIVLAELDPPPTNAVPLLLQLTDKCRTPYLAARFSDTLIALATPGDRKRFEESSRPDLTVPAFVHLLEDDELDAVQPFLTDMYAEPIRLQAANLLAKRGTPTCLRPLCELLGAEDISVAFRSLNILRQITGTNIPCRVRGEADERSEDIAAWIKWAKENEAVELLPFNRVRGFLNGNTLVAHGYNGKGVSEFDPEGKVIWNYPLNGAVSCEKLANGNVLIASYNDKKVYEVTPEKKVAWSFETACMSATALANGNVLVANYASKDVVEVQKGDNKIVWSYKSPDHCYDVERLPNGNTLISAKSVLLEVNPAGKTVWEYKGKNLFVHGAERLPNGNTLIATAGGNGTVMEVDLEGETVWKTEVKAGTSSACRLPNGNTMVTTNTIYLELDPEGKKLWEKKGTNNYGMVRK